MQRGLRRHRDPAALAADIDGLVTDADHLAMILEDLLVAADPRGDGSGETVDLCALADQVAAAGGPLAAQSDVVVDTDLPPAPVLVHGAPLALRRALTALVDNAIRHANGVVLVSVVARGSRAVVQVSDDGPGIDAEILPRLFDRFESSAGSETGAEDPADGGRRRYGLGLALVSEVAARHGGEVSARNGSPAGPGPGSAGPGAEPGTAGATLELWLPRAT